MMTTNRFKFEAGSRYRCFITILNCVEGGTEGSIIQSFVQKVLKRSQILNNQTFLFKIDFLGF